MAKSKLTRQQIREAKALLKRASGLKGRSASVAPTVNNPAIYGAQAPAQPKSNETANDQFPKRKDRRRQMQTIISTVLIVAGIAALLVTPLLYYHKQTIACWITFTAVVLFTLAGCLQWQRRIWDQGVQPETPPQADLAHVASLPKIEARYVIVSFGENKELEMRVEFTNKGKTTALNFIVQTRVFIPQHSEGANMDAGPPSVSNLGPEMSVGNIVKSGRKISPEAIKAIKDEQVGFRLWSWGTYDDEFGSGAHPFAFCWAYRKEFGTLVHCTREQYSEWKPPYEWK